MLFIVMSHLAHFDLWQARMQGIEFSKIVAYFLLLTAVLNSSDRFFKFLAGIVVFTIIVNTISVLEFHGIIDLPMIEAVLESEVNPDTGEVYATPRMRASGIFGDPNDLSMIIVASLVICTCGLFYHRFGVLRPFLLAPMGFLGYSLSLTQSRGGLLALLAGLGMVFYSRFGFWRAAMLGGIALPGALLAFGGGRQTNFSSAIAGGSGQGRAELWSGSLEAFKTSPVFGIGKGFLPEYIGLDAHNSYVQAFTELGFFGGVAFLGVFAVVGWSLWTLRKYRYQIDDPTLRHALPYILALFTAYGISMMSLSRTYVVPTYMMAGLGTAYGRLALRGTSVRLPQLDSRVVRNLLFAGVGFILFIYMYIKLLYRMG
jgi:hypothetical protein